VTAQDLDRVTTSAAGSVSAVGVEAGLSGTVGDGCWGGSWMG